VRHLEKSERPKRDFCGLLGENETQPRRKFWKTDKISGAITVIPLRSVTIYLSCPLRGTIYPRVLFRIGPRVAGIEWNLMAEQCRPARPE
jgi:hypothetical protein